MKKYDDGFTRNYKAGTTTCYEITCTKPDMLSRSTVLDTLARMKAMQPYQYYTMNNIGQWSIIAYPNLAWAKKVFPKLNDDDAMEALWRAILRTSRVEVNKTLTNWEAHILTDAQKLYAATDAWTCINLYEEIERLKQTGDYELITVEEPKPEENE